MKPTQTDSHIWLTMTDFETIYGIGIGTIRKMVREGKLEARKDEQDVRSPRTLLIRDPGLRMPKPGEPIVHSVPLLRETEVMQILGVTSVWVRNEVNLGKLRHIVIARRNFFSVLDIREYLMRREARKRNMSEKAALVAWAKEQVTQIIPPAQQT